MTAPPEMERQDGWMKSARGSEQHFQPVWKHQRGRKEGREGKKKKKGKTVVGDETMGARVEQRGGSTRQEEMREGGKVESVEGENRHDYQGKIPRWGERDGRVWSRQRGKRAWGEGRKGVGGQREGEEEEEYRLNANREPKLSSELYPSQAEEQQSQTHFLSPWP